MTTTTLPPPASRGRDLSRSIVTAGVAMLLMAWGITAAFLTVQYNEALQTRGRENLRLARALQETTVRVLAAVDQATRRVAQAVARGDYEPGQVVQIASETGLVPDILVQLSLVDADGRFAGSNLDPQGTRTGHVDLREREHVRAQLEPASLDPGSRLMSAGGLFIGKPVLGKVSGRWTIQLSRRIEGPGGRVMGVVVASLDPGYFESMYRSVELGPRDVVSLIGADRTVRARIDGGRSVGMGTRTGDGGPLSRPEVPDRGQFVGPSGVDGLERATAFHRVAGYPLYVFVGTNTVEALADWRALCGIAVALMTVLTMVSGVALAGFARGIGRLESSNRSLAISEARANAANQAKTEFLAAVSHELRTPLTSIRGFAELMEQRLQEPRFRESAGMIRRSAEHLNELLTEILDFAKMEAGAMPISAEPVALRALVQDTVGLFRITAVEKDLLLNVALDDDLPDTVVTDGLRLKQVLNNLLSNALKFTAQGGVTIHGSAQASQLVLEVADTGPGIPAALHDTIFERFRQASAQVANDHGGTGLGLALARGLAERMGGTLTVASEPGQGATFRLAIPLVVPAA